MEKETINSNLRFVRLQVRNLYIAVLKDDFDAADDVMGEIDDSIQTIVDDVEELFEELEVMKYGKTI